MSLGTLSRLAGRTDRAIFYIRKAVARADVPEDIRAEVTLYLEDLQSQVIKSVAVCSAHRKLQDAEIEGAEFVPSAQSTMEA